MVSGIFRRNCNTLAQIRGRNVRIFDTDLCRAVKVEEPGRQGEEVYFFTPDATVNSSAQALADSMVVGAVTGIPVGTGMELRVILPAGEQAPERLTMEKTLNATVLFIPVTLQTEYVLERVGD